VPDEAPAAEEEEEPQWLCCPITHTMFRDPVFVCESGNTYERAAIEMFWSTAAGGLRDPLTNRPLTTRTLYINWDKRREVTAWLSERPTIVPAGWDSRNGVPSADPTTRAPRVALRQRLLGGGSLKGLVTCVGLTMAVVAGLGGLELIMPAAGWRAVALADPPPLWAGGGEAGARDMPSLGGSWLQARERRPSAGGEAKVSVYSPRAQLANLDVAGLAFSVATLSFTACWTSAAREAPLPLALFAVPFWFVGAKLLCSALAPLVEAIGIELDESTLSIHSELDAARRHRVLRRPLAELSDVRLEATALLNDTPQLVLALELGAGTVEWGGGLTAAELRWVCGLIRAFLSERAAEPRARTQLSAELRERLRESPTSCPQPSWRVQRRSMGTDEDGRAYLYNDFNGL
jgi:hypothetical protein